MLRWSTRVHVVLGCRSDSLHDVHNDAATLVLSLLAVACWSVTVSVGWPVRVESRNVTTGSTLSCECRVAHSAQLDNSNLRVDAITFCNAQCRFLGSPAVHGSNSPWRRCRVVGRPTKRKEWSTPAATRHINRNVASVRLVQLSYLKQSTASFYAL